MLNHTIIQYKHNIHAKTMHNLDFLYSEVASRMQDRLDYIKLNPQNILDIGSGMQIDSIILQNKYPKATVYQLDNALQVIKQYMQKNSMIKKIFTKSNYNVCGDAINLPFQNQSIDIAWSNLTMPYIDRLEEYFKEISRVLKIGGYFLVSGLGVDSLYQLRDIGLVTYNFPDMHIIGDILVKLGFSNPVTDRDYITIEYDNFNQLILDIRILGCGAATQKNTTFGRNQYNILNQKFIDITRNGKIPLTLEVFYAHAWKNKITLDLLEGEKIIQFHK